MVPAMVMHAKAALGGDGKIADWQYEVWSNSHSTRPESTDGTNVLAGWYLAEPQKMGPPTSPPQPAGGGDRNAIPLYDFPNQRVVHHFVQDMPIRVSALRTLGAYANVFALESFMDELAAAAGADPIAFRLAHLKDPRARAVIEAVAKKAGWKDGEKGDGTRGRGIGFAKYKNLACYVAVVAEVAVDRATGMVSVPQTWAAVNSGLIINPDGLTSQIEGGIVQSVSWTLKEEVRFDRDGILVLAGNVHPPVGLRAEGVDDGVVELGQLVVGDVTADLHVAEEAEPGALRDPLERTRDGLDLGVVGRDAEPDEAPRSRQPVEHVHLDDRLLAREQRSRGIEPRRPRADNRHAKVVLGGHASRIMARGCGEPRRNRGCEHDEACLRSRRRDRRRWARRRRRLLGRLGLVGEPAARDLQRDGLRDPGRRRRAGDGHGNGWDARDLRHRPARAGRRADSADSR